MRSLIVIAAFSTLLATVVVVSGDCPFTSGKAVEYCNIDVMPEERLYGQEMTVNISTCFLRECEPIDKGTKVEIQYYNKYGNLTKAKFKTDETGIITFKPKVVGFHLVKGCNKALLIYVNTSCGDGICAAKESRMTCAEDCGDCGDGICDNNENLSCSDCAVCGDDICTVGESRNNCLKDCVFCGDKICDYVEDRSICPEDCPSGEIDNCCDSEEDGICDPDCAPEEDPDCIIDVPEPVNEAGEPIYTTRKVVERDEGMEITLAIIAMILGTAVLFLWYMEKKKKEQDSEKPKKKS